MTLTDILRPAAVNEYSRWRVGLVNKERGLLLPLRLRARGWGKRLQFFRFPMLGAFQYITHPQISLWGGQWISNALSFVGV